MGFTFGFIGSLQTQTGTICFLAVIGFVLIAEFLIGFLEHLLEGNIAYNRMIQKIYKELMLMGILSFMILMYEADLEGRDAETEEIHEWILAIDFGHIVLFFYSIFYVMHSFMMMVLTGRRSKEYFTMFSMPASEVIQKLTDAFENPYRQFQYYLTYWPVCSVRETIEFKLMSKLFASSYTLPNDFNFALYLSGCLEGYALKTVEVGFHTWVTMFLLVLLNYARVQANLVVSCEDDVAHTDDHSPTSYPTEGPTQGSERRHLGTVILRMLGGAPAATDDHGSTGISECSERMMTDLFLFAAAAVILYVVVILVVARVYEVRLLRQVGVNDPSDYVRFLAFSEKQRQEEVMEVGVHKYQEEGVNGRKELKVIIEAMLDDDEVDEEEEMYRHIVEHLHECNLYVHETMYDLMGAIRTMLNPPEEKEEDSIAALTAHAGGAARCMSTVASPTAEVSPMADAAKSKKTVMKNLTSNKVGPSPMSPMSPAGAGAPFRPSFSNPSLSDQNPSSAGSDQVQPFVGIPGTPGTPGTLPPLVSPPQANAGAPKTRGTGNFSPMAGITESLGKMKDSYGLLSADDSSQSPNQSMQHDGSFSAGAPMSYGNHNGSFSAGPMSYGNQSYGNQSYGNMSEDEDDKYGTEAEERPQGPASMSIKQMRAKLHGTDETFNRRGRRRAPTDKDRKRNQKGPNALSSTKGFNAVSAKVNPVRARALSVKPGVDGNLMSALENIREAFNSEAGSGKLNDSKVMASYDISQAAYSAPSAISSPVVSGGRQVELMSMTTEEKATVSVDPAVHHRSAPTEMSILTAPPKPRNEEEETARHKLEEEQQHRIDMMVAEDNFVRQEEEADHLHTQIFFLQSPNLFFSCVDIGIMLHSMYLALWATSFITIVGGHQHHSAIYQLLMFLPPVICFPCIALTIKICSQLNAVVYLDLKVIGAVLEEQEDMEVLKAQLRDRIVTQISSLTGDQRQQRHFVHVLFWDIDTDKSNTVDIFEFRQFLKLLRLNYR